MDQNTDTQTAQASSPSGATPFPTSSQAASRGDGAGATTVADSASRQQPDSAGAASASPVVDSLIKRVTQRAHDAVDGVADRLSSTVEGLQGGVSKAGESRDEWIDSAREAIRQHPFAAIGTAVLVGLAWRSLTSSSRER